MYYINFNTYINILNAFSKAPIESGGILGIDNNNTICKFYFDKTAKHTNSSYTPSISILNRIINNWHQDNISFIGIVHSHANLYNQPSYDDSIYAKAIKDSNPSLPFLIFPIVTIIDNNPSITFYKYKNNFSKIKIILKNQLHT